MPTFNPARMTALYDLKHLHVMPSWKTVDEKGIGTFLTLEEATSVRERLVREEGFRDYPEGFAIEEFEIDVPKLIDGFDPSVWIHLLEHV